MVLLKGCVLSVLIFIFATTDGQDPGSLIAPYNEAIGRVINTHLYGNFVNLSNFEDDLLERSDEYMSTVLTLQGLVSDFTGSFLNHARCRRLLREQHPEVQDACMSEMEIWCDDLKTEGKAQRQMYALKMLDSWGTPELGILEGNIRWPGRYWECKTAQGPQVEGKYCTAFYGRRYFPYTAGYPTDASIGTCFPSSCNETDVTYWMTYFFARENRTRLDRVPLVVKCPVDDYSFDTPTIIFIVVLVVLGTFVIFGTIHDVYLRTTESSRDGLTISGKLLLSFSAVTNTEKLLDTRRAPGVIASLDGIRTISATWVLLAHVYTFLIYGFDNSRRAVNTLIGDPAMLAILNGSYCVDTFFLMSGILVTYLGMKQLKKMKASKFAFNIPLMYLQRYLRLTPTYAFVILFVSGFMKFFGDGPYWSRWIAPNLQYCREQWWMNLLYINNIYPLASNLCAGVGWYMACEMQFYIIFVPFLLLALKRNKHFGLSLITLLMVGGMVVCGVLSADYGLQSNPVGSAQIFTRTGYFLKGRPVVKPATYSDKYRWDLYYSPWARIHAYMVGMLAGYYLYATKLKIRISKPVAVIGWLAATGTALALVYGVFYYTSNQAPMTIPLAAFYNAVSRPVWCMCVVWVIIACVAGVAGPVASFLEWKFWMPLSKLTFSVYLIHVYIIFWYLGTSEEPIHFTQQLMVMIFLGTVFIAFSFAYLISLLVEMPAAGLLKLAFGKSSKPKPKVEDAEKISIDSKPPSNTSEAEENHAYKNQVFEKDEVSQF